MNAHELMLPAAELGSVFYSVREKNFDERGNRQQADREFSKRAELETEMARHREEYVSYFMSGVPSLMKHQQIGEEDCRGGECGGIFSVFYTYRNARYP
jgi:hypothetical protein